MPTENRVPFPLLNGERERGSRAGESRRECELIQRQQQRQQQLRCAHTHDQGAWRVYQCGVFSVRVPAGQQPRAGKVFARFEVSASAMNNRAENTLLSLLFLLLRHSTLISSWSHISAHTHQDPHTDTRTAARHSALCVDCLEHLHCFVVVVEDVVAA